MVLLQSTRQRTCIASYILERPGETGTVELRCGLHDHGGGMHCDTRPGFELWWMATGG